MNQLEQNIGIDTDQDTLSGQQIDWLKFRLIARKSLPWIGLIFLISFSVAVLYLRYTKPMYESSSEIKLDQEERSNVLGLPQFEQNNNLGLLSSEMELIQSRLFFSKVIETVNLNPQYFTYGNILVDEKFLNPPFKVDYKVLDLNIYNHPIDLTIKNNEEFELSYKLGKETYSVTGLFGDSIRSQHLQCVVHFNKSFTREAGAEFYFKINSKEELINYIESNLTVEPLNLQANTFKISFKDHNYNKAHALVSAIDTLYYNYSLQEKTKANRSKIEYLNEQLRETEKKLDDFESYFEEFTIDNQTVNLDEDVKRTIEAINSLDSQRINVNERIEEIELFQKKLSSIPYENLTPNSSIFPPYLNKSIEEFNLQNNDLQKLGLSYKENTYTYKSRKKEVELLRGDILSDINDIKAELYERLRDLANEKNQLRSQLLKLPSKSTEYNKSKRFYELYEEMYLTLMQSKNEFEIAIAGSVTKIKILSPASLPKNPIYPMPSIAYAAAGLLSLVFSFLFIGTNYLLHNKLQSIREIEFLTKAPILGSVPKHKLNKSVAQIIVDKYPKSAVSEALRSIRTNIEFMVPDKATKVLSVTSTVGSEGKTFVSTNLAALMAMAGKKTVVVDLDLRKPKIHLAFDREENKIGVSSILINKSKVEQCIVTSHIQNLDFISAGPIPPNPSELILRKEFDSLIEYLRGKYDIVILDTPPVGLVTDGLLTMQKADLPVYILRADFSKRSFVQNVNRILNTKKFNNLSIILNATTASETGYGYGYGKKGTYYES
ncbi:MAG: polysaccharide biosynthesis tyrosine autokinase [Cyclobacteriaceae bacterium]|nr:polysaccharide biosynthesis tyrosine autokinase [Cyclobacteriaceae bacterium]